MSRDSMKIYKEAEEENYKMIRKVRKFVIIGLMVCYFPSTLPPIAFLIIGTPEPKQWQLPFVVRTLDNFRAEKKNASKLKICKYICRVH